MPLLMNKGGATAWQYDISVSLAMGRSLSEPAEEGQEGVGAWAVQAGGGRRETGETQCHKTECKEVKMWPHSQDLPSLVGRIREWG